MKSRELYSMFAQVLDRVMAPEKRVPAIIWGREPEVIRAFLDGYAAADAHVDRRGYREYATASSRLASEVRMLHLELGDAVSNISLRERKHPIEIRGRAISKALPLHRFSFYPDSPRIGSQILDYRGARRALPDERFGVATVSSNEPLGDAATYDIEVEGVHNFIADGLVVHNCPQLTVHAGYTIADTLPLIPPLGPGHRTTVQGGVDLIPMVCTVIRCLPIPEDFPNAQMVPKEKLEAAAMDTHADMWAIVNTTWDLHAKELLFAPRERELFMDPAVPLVPAGGCGGYQIQIRVSLYGYKLGT